MTKLRVFVVASALLILSVAQAQAPSPPDPWTRVPSTTSCYIDNFNEQLDSARAAVTADFATQKAVNEELEKKLNAISPGEKATRMQTFLMKDPQRGMKLMQELQQAGAQGTDNGALDAVKEAGELERGRGLPKIAADFKAAIDEAKAPVKAEQAAWAKAKATRPVDGGKGFATLADVDHAVDLVRKENVAYERVCANFYGATGPYGQWLASYKAALVKSAEAAAQQNRGVEINLQMMDIPGTYRSEATYDAVGKYLTAVSSVYRNRLPKGQDLDDLRRSLASGIE